MRLFKVQSFSFPSISSDEIFGEKLGKEKAEELAKTLVQGTWTHDYPLTPKNFKNLESQ
jgi:hypothetical protein